LQNIAVRKYLERRAREKEADDAEKAEREKAEAKANKAAQTQVVSSKAKAAEEAAAAKAKKKKKGSLFGRKKDDDETEVGEDINEADLYHSPRPAFYAHTKPTRRTQVPRDVAVPYFRFRKERFYDWPPDPTVSRATPLMAAGHDNAGSVHGRGDGRRRRPREESFDEDDEEDLFE